MGQYGIKKDKYDRRFTEFIKLRDRRCQRCGKESGQLETSHHFTRSIPSLRCDPDNACLLCNGCHRWWHSSPIEAAEWLKGIIGQGAYDRLRYRATSAGKWGKLDKDMQHRELGDQIKAAKAGSLRLTAFNPQFRW